MGSWSDKWLQWIGSGQQAAAWAFWFGLEEKRIKINQNQQTRGGGRRGFIYVSDPAHLERHVHYMSMVVTV